MSFWKESFIKSARKEHTCVYCNKDIKVGDTYIRETGIFEGDFNDYCLCPRCQYLVNKYDSGEVLSCLYDTLVENDYIVCPACGSINFKDFKVCEDKNSVYGECRDCGDKFATMITLDALIDIDDKYRNKVLNNIMG